MEKCKYTVLMSVYYKEKPEYLDKSIKSMLGQTIFPDEFIIIKDGSLTAELNNIIDSYEIKYPRLFSIIENNTNLGLGPSLAKGIIASKNSLIARMDSDDYCVPNRCEKQIREFEKNPLLDVVGSFEVEFIDDINNSISIHKVPQEDIQIRKFMKRRCALLHPTVMYKKETVIKCGNYRDVPLYEDYDLFARMVLEHNAKAYNIQENLYFIRTSEDFYKRRGGMGYAKTVLRFKWNQYKNGYMNIFDFIVSGFGQVFVCILPNFLRKRFYMIFLRKGD